MAMIHEITEQVGKHKRRKRIGRGPGSGHGKTAGRGHKGAKSRSGWSGSIHPLYEGGQMPFFQRIPKRGFSNVQFARQWAVVNVKLLQTNFADGDTVDAQTLAEKHLVHKGLPVKILGEGELTKKLTVAASKFSASAKQKIEQAGGTAQLVDLPDPAARAAEKRFKGKKVRRAQSAQAVTPGETPVTVDMDAAKKAAEEDSTSE